jgi:hypothetical protein
MFGALCYVDIVASEDAVFWFKEPAVSIFRASSAL